MLHSLSEFCFSLFVQLMIHPVLVLIIFFSFAFSSLMLQVSLNNGTTFVSSNVNVTTKICTQPVKPNEEKEPTKVGYVVVFT